MRQIESAKGKPWLARGKAGETVNFRKKILSVVALSR
jgi:hypothetical protein